MKGIFPIVLAVSCFCFTAFGEEKAVEKPILAGEPYVYTEWEAFTTESTHGGLINDHIFGLTADGNRLWIGTENGLVLYENGKWKHWTEEDGLPWRVVSSIAVSPKTGDVWVGMFGGGIARFSAGRFDHFHQLNSGLVNDVVYSLDVEGDNIWVATTAGVSSYNTITGEWEIYTEKNAPMEEIWCYSLDATKDKVHVAVWGGGILEWDVKDRTWTDHHDPDGEMEIDLYRDDGLIHIITTSASYVDNILWASTYFGLSRYDGRHWRGYMDHDSGLASSFINLAKGRSGTCCYNATDYGLAVLVDFETDTWVTYLRETEDAKTWTAEVKIGNELIRKVPTQLSLPNHFIICVEFMGDDVWIGTGHGLARGIGTGYWPGLKKSEKTVSAKTTKSE